MGIGNAITTFNNRRKAGRVRVKATSSSFTLRAMLFSNRLAGNGKLVINDLSTRDLSLVSDIDHRTLKVGDEIHLDLYLPDDDYFEENEKVVIEISGTVRRINHSEQHHSDVIGIEFKQSSKRVKDFINGALNGHKVFEVVK